MERPKLIGLVRLEYPILLRREEPRELASSVAFDTEGRAWYPVFQLHAIQETAAGAARAMSPRLRAPVRAYFVRWQRAQDMPFHWEPFPTPAPPDPDLVLGGEGPK